MVLYMHRQALIGWSTCTTAFQETVQYFTYTMKTHSTYAWRSLVKRNCYWYNGSYVNLGKKKTKVVCVFLVSQPTLIFFSDPKVFIDIPKTFSLYTLGKQHICCVLFKSGKIINEILEKKKIKVKTTYLSKFFMPPTSKKLRRHIVSMCLLRLHSVENCYR